MKRLVQMLCMVAWSAAAAQPSPDRVYLRDGRILEGRIMGERGGQYTFVAETHQQIPKAAVKFVVYADPVRADQYLGLSRASRLGKDPDTASVTILPAEAYGEAIVPVAQAATQSIRIAAYYITGMTSGPIKEFYDVLRTKARSGVEVAMVCEYSADTRPSVRNATRNFVEEHLAPDGVALHFVTGGKTMHKRLIIVDGRTVLLGSSNLTGAGTMTSTELNARIESARFARRAMADFERLRALAVPADKLK